MLPSIIYSFFFPFTGTLTVEEVYKDRDQFAALVREVAAPDVGRMGIEILSFTIKDVFDDVQYLQSLGKAQTASVKRDADAGVAEANRYVCKSCFFRQRYRYILIFFFFCSQRCRYPGSRVREDSDGSEVLNRH
jgi:hypothetical protein